ncbi:hypothetical protein BO70DRAFT_363251 [Aspergillus heteromorphus CBS 117.55]|uniref:Uncharacterized protein n=1 Tax=Aspergillus heteromorphus CBS 117.55 TaxID=1448321 RepID=A0A317VZC4_9EURO|nr:uncharacterized protein BO70DRAFT_363251 [Aspergillus heteromorphus CBS 117.55]PWY78372.1 hypothetical protein BO70DRAFT_363251 [Aspergillus heteromorphus CBS 117.55]
MPYSLEKPLDLIGRPQGLVTLPLASSPNTLSLCHATPYVSDLTTCGLFSPSDCTRADARWVPEPQHDYDSEEPSSSKQPSYQSLPCCHHAQGIPPGMEDVPLDAPSRHALEEYSSSFDQHRLLKRRLSTLTHSPQRNKVG